MLEAYIGLKPHEAAIGWRLRQTPIEPTSRSYPNLDTLKGITPPPPQFFRPSGWNLLFTPSIIRQSTTLSAADLTFKPPTPTPRSEVHTMFFTSVHIYNSPYYRIQYDYVKVNYVLL